MRPHSRATTHTPRITLDATGAEKMPMWQLLATRIRALITEGILQPGENLPSTRMLASDLNCSRTTVLAAYDQLTTEGFLVAIGGSGTRVNPNLQLPAQRPSQTSENHTSRPPRRPPAMIDLRPIGAQVQLLDTTDWRRSWRRAAESIATGVQTLATIETFRLALSDYLRQSRGITAPPSQLLATAGSRQAVTLILNAETTRLGRQLVVGVEDPGYQPWRRLASEQGARVIPIPVLETGIDISALATHSPDVVICTPNHHYPLGGHMPVTSRIDLLRWAHAAGSLIIEDDYDSEFRYDAAPLPPLSDLASGVDFTSPTPVSPVENAVITLGTFSKTLSPQLNLGYLLAAPKRLEYLEQFAARWQGNISLVTQMAISDFIFSGGMSRHLWRARRLYRTRKQQVELTLRGLPGVRVIDSGAGAHSTVLLDSRVAADRVLSRASAQNILLADLSNYWHQDPGQSGFLIGFAQADDRTLATGLQQLAEILKEILE